MQALRAIPKHSMQAIMQKQAALWKGKYTHEIVQEVLYLPRAYITEWLCSQQEQLDLRGLQMPVSKLLTLIYALQAHSAPRVLHFTCSSRAVYSSDESLCILNALKEVVSILRQLSVLGLHCLQLQKDHLDALSEIFYEVKGCLTGLALSLRDWQFQVGQLDCSSLCKLRFFEGIAQLKNLKLLAIPQWKGFVACEKSALAPLRKFQTFAVLVDSSPEEASEACAIVPGLRFSRVETSIFK
jgi:hypothetical protein